MRTFTRSSKLYSTQTSIYKKILDPYTADKTQYQPINFYNDTYKILNIDWQGTYIYAKINIIQFFVTKNISMYKHKNK